MLCHDPNGSLLAVHSVVIDSNHRRKTYASQMMSDYIVAISREAQITNAAADTGCINKIILMAKSNLLGFYVQSGFCVTKTSDIVHGSELWYELELSLVPSLAAAPEDNNNNSNRNTLPKFWVVDSFAIDGKYGSGNPAAVVLLPNNFDTTTNTDPQKIEWMKIVACEFNLSETAFVWKNNDAAVGDSQKKNSYQIRYFSGTGIEVDLCGHATLAAAQVVFLQQGKMDKKFPSDDEITFATKFIELKAYRDNTRDGGSSNIIMDFPWREVDPIQEYSVEESIKEMLGESLNINEEEIILLGVGDNDAEDLFVHITPKAFRAMPTKKSDINFGRMMACPGYNRGIIICCQNDDATVKADFLSRFFGPKVGIDEDPVTGSAHCLLAPYFSRRVLMDKSTSTVRGMQASKRGGMLRCELLDECDKSNNAGNASASGDDRYVRIIGSALIASSGELHIQ